MRDHLVRALSGDGCWRAAAASTAHLTEELRLQQGTDPTATVAAGRLAAGAALMVSQLKGEQRLALKVEGNGPLQRIIAESEASGRLRVSVKQPVSGLPPTAEGFPVADAVGRAGFLHVTKDLGLKEPYHGVIQLPSSEIAEDLATYFTTSEQTPSSVALGVALGPEGEVVAAGGLLVQALPGAGPREVATLEERLKGLPAVTELLRGGQGPAAILEEVLEGLAPRLLGETALELRCTCSRGQLLRLLGRFDAETRDDLRSRSEPTEIVCEFCRRVYRFTPDEVRAALPADPG